MRTMAYDVVGDLIITVHTESAPSDAEWKGYVEALREVVRTTADYARLRNIVFSDGGAPNSLQRKVVNDIIAGRDPIPVALVSGSALARGVVTALAWFNPKIKAFPPQEADEAYRHLGFSRAQIDTFRIRLDKLQTQIGTKIHSIAEASASTQGRR